MKDILIFDNWAAPNKITSINVVRADTDSPSTGQNKYGFLRRHRIRGQATSKVSVNVTYSGLTNTEYNQLITAIEPVEFQLEYYWAGTRYTDTMYAGNRQSNCIKTLDDFESWTLTVSLINY